MTLRMPRLAYPVPVKALVCVNCGRVLREVYRQGKKTVLYADGMVVYRASVRCCCGHRTEFHSGFMGDRLDLTDQESAPTIANDSE